MLRKLFHRKRIHTHSSPKQPCPCCGNLTLEAPVGHYEICEVCFWEDDPIQSEDVTYEGGANKISLTLARQNYADFGASEDRFLDIVREATSEEAQK